MAYRSNNLVTGQQLRTARTLAGMTQRELATVLGINERPVRFWKRKQAPKGKANGAYKHGLFTVEALRERRLVSDLLRQCRKAGSALASEGKQ